MFLDPKVFGSQRFFGLNFLGHKICWPVIFFTFIFWSPILLGFDFSGPKIFGSKIFWTQNCFEPKFFESIFLDPNIFEVNSYLHSTRTQNFVPKIFANISCGFLLHHPQQHPTTLMGFDLIGIKLVTLTRVDNLLRLF